MLYYIFIDTQLYVLLLLIFFLSHYFVCIFEIGSCLVLTLSHVPWDHVCISMAEKAISYEDFILIFIFFYLLLCMLFIILCLFLCLFRQRITIWTNIGCYLWPFCLQFPRTTIVGISHDVLVWSFYFSGLYLRRKCVFLCTLWRGSRFDSIQ